MPVAFCQILSVLRQTKIDLIPLIRILFKFELLYRVPIVAKCDRKRVLSSWAPLCGNVTPLEFQVEFSNVRHLTPREFVEKLSKDLRVSGVVAGI